MHANQLLAKIKKVLSALVARPSLVKKWNEEAGLGISDLEEDLIFVSSTLSLIP